MYKILLADEEGVALRALRVMIDTDYEKDCDIRLAMNTQQMLEIFPKFQPDILFVNMQMPGLHGITTIRELHAINYNCQFIVVSYSNKIDYGREGKCMGVYSYMPKPFKAEPVKRMLKSCFAHITAQQKQEEITKYNKEQWDAVIPMIEGGLVSEFLFSDESDSNFSVYKEFLNIKQEYAWTCTLKYGQMTEHGTLCNPIGSTVQLSRSNLYFRKIVKAFFPTAIVGPIIGSNVTFVIPCNEADFSEEQDAMRKKRVDDLAYQLQRKLNMRFRPTLTAPRKI